MLILTHFETCVYKFTRIPWCSMTDINKRRCLDLKRSRQDFNDVIDLVEVESDTEDIVCCTSPSSRRSRVQASSEVFCGKDSHRKSPAFPSFRNERLEDLNVPCTNAAVAPRVLPTDRILRAALFADAFEKGVDVTLPSRS